LMGTKRSGSEGPTGGTSVEKKLVRENFKGAKASQKQTLKIENQDAANDYQS